MGQKRFKLVGKVELPKQSNWIEVKHMQIVAVVSSENKSGTTFLIKSPCAIMTEAPVIARNNPTSINDAENLSFKYNIQT